MEGIHATSDAVFVLARLGPKRAEEGAYVWQKLMKSGAIIANGTDAPVEDIDPIPSFYASVARKLKDGSRVLSGSADVAAWRRCAVTRSTPPTPASRKRSKAR